MNTLLATLELWLYYFLSFWPAVPGFGRLIDADCIFVQAFGRNMYDDAHLGRILGDFRRRTNDNDLETFYLLKMEGFDPGKSNRALANYARRMFGFLKGAPIITQWEVAYALFEMDAPWFMRHRQHVICLWPPEEGYFATAHVKEMSREHMLRLGKSRPLELAHPAMITRAVPIIWGTGIQPVVEPIAMGDVTNHPLWVWDENSVQPWTRNWKAWRMREFIGRIAHVGSWGLARINLLNTVRSLAPDHIRPQIPGDWIALIPPRLVPS